MNSKKGALLFAQSGGPTAVINSSASGVFLTALKNENITAIYAAEHGIRGVLEEALININKEDITELERLKTTPSSAIGSVRYKLKDIDVDDSDYLRLLEVFKKYDIKYFLYNGGNDSMDTANKIANFMKDHGHDVCVVGVPKTIDNDLAGTDHCPGFGSAAKYIATTVAELALDLKVYDTGIVCIIEVMGRNAGWLTGAAALAKNAGFGADLIYMPEKAFSLEQFVSDVKNVLQNNNNKCIVVVSEGIRYANGDLVGDFKTAVNDGFNHAQLGGVSDMLKEMVKDIFKVKVRAIEFSLLQRCASHIASKRDVEEAFICGQKAVELATQGVSGVMVAMKRCDGDEYAVEYVTVPLTTVANTEKTVPENWINEEGNYVTQEMVDYIMPLIYGESSPAFENGLPVFAKLKKEKV